MFPEQRLSVLTTDDLQRGCGWDCTSVVSEAPSGGHKDSSVPALHGTMSHPQGVSSTEDVMPSDAVDCHLTGSNHSIPGIEFISVEMQTTFNAISKQLYKMLHCGLPFRELSQVIVFKLI